MRVLAAKLRAVMPEESPIDLDRHAYDVARIVLEARGAAVRRHVEATRTWLADATHAAADADVEAAGMGLEPPGAAEEPPSRNLEQQRRFDDEWRW